MILGFTGTSLGMTTAQLVAVKELFERLKLHVLHHGCCIGSDAEAHKIASRMQALVVGHPPRDTKLIATGLNYDELYIPYEYLTRNRHIVRGGRDGLVATPSSYMMPKNLRGQGTWTTIGYGRQASKHIWIVFPDGKIEEE